MKSQANSSILSCKLARLFQIISKLFPNRNELLRYVRRNMLMTIGSQAPEMSLLLKKETFYLSPYLATVIFKATHLYV